MQKSTRGFTIVELLIVIVVIGILATITIVAFNGIQTRANTAAATSDLAAFRKAVELFKLDSAGNTYPTSIADLESLKVKLTGSAYMTGTDASINLLYCVTSGAGNYALLGMTKNGVKLYVTNTEGAIGTYTGADSWNGADYTVRCRTVLANSLNTAHAGYSRGDTTNGPWRPWTSVGN